ncbi:MAG: hypothetical protein M1823_001141 [Watsoniomyces obsoletus]|nr:MAG: hypothetical protein M1823_001141 [Watsoniomyces obsoletus]
MSASPPLRHAVEHDQPPDPADREEHDQSQEPPEIDQDQDPSSRDAEADENMDLRERERERERAESQSHGMLPYEFEVKEQDRWLPIANVARIMKLALPENAKIAKEAKECMQECVSEFISFITSEASEKCQQEKRKTVNGEDILFAMTSLGFENYAEALKIYLTKYRESQTARGDNQPRGGNNGATATAGAGGGGGESTGTGTTSAPTNTTSSSTAAYRERSESANLLSPGGVGDVPEHDPGGYGVGYSSVGGGAGGGGGGHHNGGQAY